MLKTIEIQITMYKIYFQEPDHERKFQQDLFSKP